MHPTTTQSAEGLAWRHPLLVVAAALAVGICFDRFGAEAVSPARAVGWWAVAVTVLAAWWGILRRGRSSMRHLFAGILLCGGMLAAGAAWHHACWNLYTAAEIGRYARDHPAPTYIEAIALQSPRRLPAIPTSPYRAIPIGERSQLDVRVTGIRCGTDWRVASGRGRIRVNGQLLGIHAGDRLRIFAAVVSPTRPRNPGEFDYAAHARAERRLAEFRCGFPECVTVVERAGSYRPRRILDRMQAWCVDYLYRELSPENGPIAAALLLGVREGIAREDLETFQQTGTIHLLVVSGLHVGILAAVARFLVGLFCSSRRAALVATGCVVVGFALLTGARPPVVRATVVTLGVLAAFGAGRRVLTFNTLAGAAVVVLAANPADLFRIGPQLSFLAATTFIWYGQRVAQRQEAEDPVDRLRWESRPPAVRLAVATGGWAWQLTAAGACLWLVALPLVMARFNLAAPIALLLAPWICAVAWVSLVSGFGLLAAGWLFPWFDGGVRLLCDATIHLLQRSVTLAEALPGAHFSVPGPPDWWLLGAYLGLWGALLVGSRTSAKWKLAVLSLWVAVGLGNAGLGPAVLRPEGRGSLACTFLSVGHGTSVVLELPDGKTLLYDAGSLMSPDRAASSIRSYLLEQGIMRLDGIVLSHADIDHFNAVPRLLAHVAVSTVFVSPVMFDPLFQPDPTSAPRRLESELASRGVAVREVFAGDRLRLGAGVVAEILHPPREGLIASDNANSIVLALEYAGRRILLTGDLESPGMEDLQAELPYDVDVLLAPHHGSRFSDPPGLAYWCSPEWVVISGGDEESASETAGTYRRMGARVLHTSSAGAVQFELREDQVIARHWDDGSWKRLSTTR